MVKVNTEAPDLEPDPNLFADPSENVEYEDAEDATASVDATVSVAESSPADEQEGESSESSSDEEFFAQLTVIGEICRVQRDRESLEQDIAEQQESAKRAKDLLKNEEEKLSELRDELADLTSELLDLNRELLLAADGRDGGLPTRTGNAGWRNRSTKDLLDGAKGLGKKLESIIELAPTVGHLEDLRSEASREHVEFKDKLPRGCGANVAKVIEDRLVDHIAAFAQAADDPDRVQLAEELLEEVRTSAEENNWQKEDCVPSGIDDEYIHAGYSAYEEGQPHTAMMSLDRAKARQWMVGWVGAERLRQLQSDAA